MNSYSTSCWSLLLINRPREDERLSWPCWLTYCGRFTHINGYPSAAGPVQTSESSPVRDRRSTTEPPNQYWLINGDFTGDWLASWWLQRMSTARFSEYTQKIASTSDTKQNDTCCNSCGIWKYHTECLVLWIWQAAVTVKQYKMSPLQAL